MTDGVLQIDLPYGVFVWNEAAWKVAEEALSQRVIKIGELQRQLPPEIGSSPVAGQSVVIAPGVGWFPFDGLLSTHGHLLMQRCLSRPKLVLEAIRALDKINALFQAEIMRRTQEIEKRRNEELAALEALVPYLVGTRLESSDPNG